MWEYDHVKAAKAAKIQLDLRLGAYQNCYDAVMADQGLADYLPPAFFRELAVHLYAQDHWPAQYLLEYMSRHYPTSPKTMAWLAEADRGGSQ